VLDKRRRYRHRHGLRGHGLLFMLTGLLLTGLTAGAIAAAPSGERPSPQTKSETGVPQPFTLGPLDAYADMVNRPLFSPGRRPSASTPGRSTATHAPVSVHRGRFKLAGVVILGKTRYALLKYESDQDFVRIEEGQTIHDWTVTAIGPGEVVLDRRGVRDVVELSANTVKTIDKRKAARRKALIKSRKAKARLRAARRQRDNYVRRLRPDELEQSRRPRRKSGIVPRPRARGALNRAKDR